MRTADLPAISPTCVYSIWTSHQSKASLSEAIWFVLTYFTRGAVILFLFTLWWREKWAGSSCLPPAICRPAPVQTVPPSSCPVRKGPQFYREWQDIILGLMSPQYVCQDCSECAITDTFSSPPSAWCGCQRWGSLSPCDWWAECHLWSELLLCSDTSLQSERETGKYWIIITFVTIKLSN